MSRTIDYRSILDYAKPRRVQVTKDVKPCFVWWCKADADFFPKSHPEGGTICATLYVRMRALADAGELQGYREPHPGNGGIWFERWADAMNALRRVIEEVTAIEAVI